MSSIRPRNIAIFLAEEEDSHLMLRKTPEAAMQLIENERAIIRVLRSDPSDYSDLLFELKQYADPENVRPVRPLEPNADRTQVYDPMLKTFVPRELKRKERGLPQPGNLHIKAVSGTLPPTTGNMRFYNHANINKGHNHVIYGVDAGENPDRYLYLHKKDPTIEVKDEACLIVACFAKDAGTNTKWHIKGQPLNEYHAGLYPEAISFEQLKENNRNFVKNLYGENNRHKDERNEVKFKPSKAALQFIGAVSNSLEDRVNALHFKLLVWQVLKIDLPVLIFDDAGKHIYPEKDQDRDILIAFSRGVSFAFDIHDQVMKGERPDNSIYTHYYDFYVDYREYVRHVRLLNSDEALAKFSEYHEAKVLKSKLPNEEKSLSLPLAAKITRNGDYGSIQNSEIFYPNPLPPQYINDAKAHVLGRKTWGEIVSQTYDYEKANPQDKTAVLAKLKKSGIQGDLNEIYHKMCAYLQQHTKLVVAFKAEETIKKVPVSLAYLNLSDINALKLQQERAQHRQDRMKVEDMTFAFLGDIASQFKKATQARPHYAYLTFCDEANYPKPLTNDFGLSYFVLRDVVKFNSVFVPQNVFATFSLQAKSIRPCTYFNVDVLLDQASDLILLGLAHAVTGQLPQNQIRDNAGFEMHAYVPSVEMFDSNVVERIYVSPQEYKMSEAEIAFQNEHGITAVNVGTHAYAKEELEMKAAAEADDVKAMQNLLRKNPFLRYTFAQALEKGDAVLYHYMLRHDAAVKPLSWQEIFERVPVKKIALFHSEWSEAELKALNETDVDIFMTFKDKIIASDSAELFSLLLTWLKQFNAASVKLSDVSNEFESKEEESEHLLGTHLSDIIWHDLAEMERDQSPKIIELINSGLLDPIRLQEVAHVLFRNPRSHAAGRYLLEKKCYHFELGTYEKEALLAGGHYLYILDDPRMVAKAKWDYVKIVNVLTDLLGKVDDVVFLEKSFLNLQAVSAFSHLSTETGFQFISRIAAKNPTLLYVFTVAFFESRQQLNDAKLNLLIDTIKYIPGCGEFVFFLEKNRRAKAAMQEDKSEMEAMYQLTTSELQQQFFNHLLYDAEKLRNPHYIKMLFAKLPSFEFLYAADPIHYSLFCMRFYFPEFANALGSNPHLLCMQQLREFIISYMQMPQEDFHEAKALLSLYPELIHTQVPGSGDSLLHLALAANHMDVDLIRQLMHSKVAHMSNVSELTTLHELIEKQVRHYKLLGRSHVGDFNNLVADFLKVIPYSNKQLITVLNFIKIYDEDLGDYADAICALLNKNKADSDALKTSFIYAITLNENNSRPSLSWKSYLQIKSMPQSAFQDVMSYMVRSSRNVFKKQDIHSILDCATEFDYSVIKSYLEIEGHLNVYHFSHILSHPRCFVIDPEVVERLASEFTALVFNITMLPENFAVAVDNFLIILNKVNGLDELRQHDFLGTLIAKKLFDVARILLQYQFVLSEENWVSILERYADQGTIDRDLIAIIHTEPQRAWTIFYNKQLNRAVLADRKLACRALLTMKMTFCRDMQVDSALLAKINADMQDITDKLTCNTLSMRKELSRSLKENDFCQAIISIIIAAEKSSGAWKSSHATLVNECQAYKSKQLAPSDSEEKSAPVTVSLPMDVTSETNLDQLIAMIDDNRLDRATKLEAQMQFKTKLDVFDIYEGMEPTWPRQEHFKSLRTVIKTYSVLCQLDSHDDDTFTRIRVSYFYFMLRAMEYLKDEKKQHQSYGIMDMFARTFKQTGNPRSHEPATPVQQGPYGQRPFGVPYNGF